MDVLLPRTLEEALALKAAHPEAVPIAGGTDLMVEINAGRRLPALLDVSRLPELRISHHQDGCWVLGAGCTYARIIHDLPQFPPLVQASAAVGSPQIRHRGTIGGNLATASPAGDAITVFAAFDAEILLEAAGRRRTLPWRQFLLGPKKTTITPGELIVGVRWRITRGPASFSKVGPRNAMAIAVASLCLVLDEPARDVRVAMGSVGPTVLRARDAEGFAARALAEAGVWDDPRALLRAAAVDEFAEHVAAAAQPIDDVRGTAAYRRYACRVLARRALRWALNDRRAAA